MIYKKIIKGTKQIKPTQMLLYAVTICYIVIVLGATFLSRPAEVTGTDAGIEVHFFSSYREAYHNINIMLEKNVLFRNIILNIMLFIPLGFILPFYTDKLKKAYKVALIGFLATLIIEVTQHLAKYGIFEADDILNNTLGTVIGYCIFMIFYKLKNKENIKNIIKYTIPIIFTITAFIGIFVVYQNQEFGYLEFEYNYKINMKNVNVASEIDFSKEEKTKEIYHVETLNKSETKQIAKKIFGTIGKNIDENETQEFQNSVNYWTTGKNSDIDSPCRIEINYIGGTYSYVDYSDTIISKENTEFIDEIHNANREEIESSLKKLGIEVPELAEFEEDKWGNYIFSIDMKNQGNKCIDGNLTCSYFEDNTIKRVFNDIVTYEKVSEKVIKSEQEAYEEILVGKFMASNNEKIKNILIKDVTLDYRLDSKGYYVPVYVFETEINENKQRIFIKAIE